MKLNITKKILVVGLGVALVGALGFVAVNASSGIVQGRGDGSVAGVKSYGQSQDNGQGQMGRGNAQSQMNPGNGWEHTAQSDCQGAVGQGNGQGRMGHGKSQGRVAQGSRQGVSGQGNGQGQMGRGNGQGAGQRNGVNGVFHSVPASEWTTVNGQIVGLSDNKLTIQTDTGKMVIGLRPVWYWDGHGISLSAGDDVTVQGFYTDEFEPGQIVDNTTGASVTLRADDGTPLWAAGH